MRRFICFAAAAVWLGHTPLAQAALTNVRVVWDAAPSSEAVIGFSKSGSAASSGQYLKYGSSSNEANWQSATNVVSRVFKNSLSSYFVRLNGLTPNTEYFFRACDNSGCTEPYFFRTAPSDARSLSVIAGGDSRTDRSARQQGNRLVQKIRPHFVMFSGDYTDSHSAAEVEAWLTDWNLSFTPSTVGGLSAKQVYPLVPTVGNHEYSDMNFMCSVFGVDADKSGTCSLRDTYNAFNIGTLVRVYTLNTEFGSSESNERSAQRNWLNSDLAANHTATQWRFAQYHKPMFPRSSSKPASNQIALDWAQSFYDFHMNLVNESDTHLVKYTLPVRLNGNDYETLSAGTVYIGEGAWGAPVRSADRASSWIVDQDSFGHLNVLSVSANTIDIRTVRLDGEANTSTLGKAARDADPLALPEGLSLWEAASVGTVFSLKRDAQGYTQLNESVGGGNTTTLNATRDVSVGSGGFYRNGNTLYADGNDAGQQLRALLAWDVSSIAADAKISGAKIRLNITNVSAGSYQLYALGTQWAESGASYAQASPVGALLGSLTPSAKGAATLTLNSAGLDLLRAWINGSVANNGVVLLSAGSTDGVDFSSRESGNAPQLLVSD